MSFVKTLATLAVGFAAAKGLDKFNKAGGLAGLQDKMKSGGTGAAGNPLGDMMGRMGLPGGADLGKMLGGLTGGAAGGAAGGASGGIGAMLGALGGLGAAGVAGATGMIDQITGTTAASDTAEANARLMIRAMIQAAKADGRIDDDERAILMQHLSDSTPEERAFVEAELAAPVDAMALARDTAAAAAVQVYTAAAMTVRVDSPSEAQFLGTLAQGLNLDQRAVATIHASLGKPAPGV